MSRMGMDSQERLAMSNYSLVERSRKERRERILNRVLIAISVFATIFTLCFVLRVLGDTPKGFEVVNPRYVSEEITPNESETVYFQNVTREWLLEHGYTIISGPDATPTPAPTEIPDSGEVYWGPNPAYKNPVDTPNEEPNTWLPVK